MQLAATKPFKTIFLIFIFSSATIEERALLHIREIYAVYVLGTTLSDTVANQMHQNS